MYNSWGYDSAETIELISGVFDIYMPDFKYMDSGVSETLSGAADYPEVAMKALEIMHQQAGDLVIDNNGRRM